MVNNYYDILQINRYATQQEIKSAYRKLCFVYHPDRCTSSLKPVYEEKLKKINHAYGILSDENLRNQYDQRLTREHVSPKQYEYNTVYRKKPAKKRPVYKNKAHEFICDIYNTIKYEKRKDRKLLLIIGLLFVLAQPLYGVVTLFYSFFASKQMVLDVTRQQINEKLDTQFKTEFNKTTQSGE